MAARPSNWGWTPTGRRRYALLALWLAHGGWVLLGRVPGRAWSQVATVMAHPFQRLAAGFHDWRVVRAQRAEDLTQARAELALLRQEAYSFQGQVRPHTMLFGRTSLALNSSFSMSKQESLTV